MAVHVHHIATQLPEHAVEQSRARDTLASWLAADRRTERLMRAIYGRSGIERRHSVLPEFDEPGVPGLYHAADGSPRDPGTGERNGVYAREAEPLFTGAARRAVEAAEGFEASDVTHVVTVSCTGFFAPGPDLEVVRALGLPPGTERYHVGFMGCYGVFPALRMARAFCRADPEAVVLVVSVELCTLHLQARHDPDALVSASLFADGAAAALVSARPPTGPALRLERFAGTVAPRGADDMTWTIGETGFEMSLSSYVPALLEEGVGEAVAPLLDGCAPASVAHWAVHPGGPAILDGVERGLGLPPERLAPSRAVLAGCGNMSSATVLFVLRRLLDAAPEPGERVAALAFGPGLTVESGLLIAA